jgi:VIT1/CCC1 family predicted Fe2+/Mn2+ transporter
MTSKDSEAERLRRLRDRQLQARDPYKRDRRLQRTISRRHRQAAEPFSLRRLWSEIPHQWKGTLYGAIVGVLIIVLLPQVVQSMWSTIFSIAAFPVLVVLGFLLGRAMDARDSLRDLMR